MGKIKDLTRSRSIEDSGVADLIVNAGIKVQETFEPVSFKLF